MDETCHARSKARWRMAGSHGQRRQTSLLSACSRVTRNSGTGHPLTRHSQHTQRRSSLRLFVPCPQIAGWRIRTTHRREHGINQHRRSDNNPADIQPELIHDILLWLKGSPGHQPYLLVKEARADFSSGRNRYSPVIVYARPALTRHARCLPDRKKFYCRSIWETIGAKPEEILPVAKIHRWFDSMAAHV